MNGNQIKYLSVQLLLFLLAGGVASLFLRYDLLWDLANYHYYNPWAFFNNRWMYDVAPGGINTFFNPLADIPLYVLIKYFNNFPNFIIFVQGLWSGAAAFVFFKLICLFFDAKSLLGKVQISAAWLVGITSWPFFMQIGSTTNEMITVLMVSGGYYLIIKELKNPAPLKLINFGWAGICLGAAAGLKLTAATYCVSVGITMLFCYRYFKPFYRIMGVFVLSGAVGFLLTYGVWMWRLWDTFGNPLFPLLNNLFKSDWFDIRSYRDTIFLPKDIWGYIFYPFYLLLDKLPSEGQSVIMDFRNIIMSFVVGGFILFCGFRIIKNKTKISFKKEDVFLWGLWLVSYIVWLIAFSIQRYSVQFLMLSAIIIIQVATFLYPKNGNIKFIFYGCGLVLVFYSLLSTPYYSDFWGKKNDKYSHLIKFYTDVWPELKDDMPYFEKYGNYKKYVDIEDIELPNNTLLQMYGLPSAAILPELNQKSEVRGINMYIDAGHEGKIFDKGKWMELKNKIINEHNGPKAKLIVLSEAVHIANLPYKMAKNEGMNCHLVINNIYDWILCVPKELEKTVFKGRNY